MATSYTSLLGFALPVTGELSGTWGDTVNNSITQLVEDSVAGVATTSVAGGNWTLTTTGSGAANQARCAILIPTGSPGVSRNIIAPSQSKAYIVINQSDAAVVLKGAATTGVTIATGTTSLVAWNGSDFVEVGQAGDVDGPASATDNAIARFDGTTGKLIQNSAVTIADTSGDITGGKYNGLTVSTTTGTFTLTNGKTFAVQNALTLAGTDSTTMTFPGTSQTVAGLAVSGQTFTTAQTFRATDSVRAEAAATQDAIVLAGRAGGTSSYAVSLTPATLSSSTTLTLPNVNDTVATIGTAQTFTAAQTFRAANSVRAEAASTQDAVVLAGRAGGTSSYAVSLTPTTLSANRTLTLLDASTTVVGTDTTQTLTNKTVTPRITSVTSITSPFALNTDGYDIYAATAQAENLTINADSGTPTNGQKFIFRVTSDAVPRVITFTGGSSKAFKPVGVSLTISGGNFTYTLTASKTTYFGCIYNTTSARWEVVALSQEA